MHVCIQNRKGRPCPPWHRAPAHSQKPVLRYPVRPEIHPAALVPSFLVWIEAKYPDPAKNVKVLSELLGSKRKKFTSNKALTSQMSERKGDSAAAVPLVRSIHHVPRSDRSCPSAGHRSTDGRYSDSGILQSRSAGERSHSARHPRENWSHHRPCPFRGFERSAGGTRGEKCGAAWILGNTSFSRSANIEK